MQPLMDVLVAGQPGEHFCPQWQCPGVGRSGEGLLISTVSPVLGLTFLLLTFLQHPSQQLSAKITHTSAAMDSASASRTQSVMGRMTAKTILMRTTAVSTQQREYVGFWAGPLKPMCSKENPWVTAWIWKQLCSLAVCRVPALSKMFPEGLQRECRRLSACLLIWPVSVADLFLC